MVTVIPGDKTWENVGSNIGQGLVQGYTNRADEMAIQKSISQLPQDASPRQILDAITNVKTYSPASKQQALKNYMGVAEFEGLQKKAKEERDIRTKQLDIQKQKVEQKTNQLQKKEDKEVEDKRIERERVKLLVDQLDVPEEQKGALGEALSLGKAEELFKEQQKLKNATTKQTPFEQKMSAKNADEYIKLTEEIPKLQNTLDDISYARKLSDELGLTGVATSALGLSKTGKELEAVSFTLMQPIVKMFNPSGPIAQQKLKMIQDKYVVKGTDAPWTRAAKLDALERFAGQALNRANQRKYLIEQYEGNPPKDVLQKFDRDSDTMSDVMLDYDLQGQPATLPMDPKEFTNKTVTGPDGKKYYSDGTRWTTK